MAAAGVGPRSGVTDDAVRDCLAARVMQTVEPRLAGGVATPLVRNAYSFVFAVERAGSGHPGVFVKIPKQDMRRHSRHVLPLTDDDRALGAAEYGSLRYLEEAWGGDRERVRFVRPIAYFPDLNAVVTVRAAAVDALGVFRRACLRDWLSGTAYAAGRLQRIATALRGFHLRAGEPAALELDPVQQKVSRYIRCLREYGISDGSFDRLDRRQSSGAVTVMLTTTLKGIDIRNVLIDSDDAMHLLDPGAIKRAPAEADLARFILTWRILFWGTAAFALGVVPPRRAEAAFLAAYGAFESRALRLMLVKEVLKHWATARDSLRLKAWDSTRTRVVAALYVDRFYRRQLRAEAAGLDR